MTRLTISSTTPNSNGGTTNMLTVTANDGIQMKYGHFWQKDVPASLKIGAWVTAGQYLFPVGNQGNSTGYHLHFEVWRDGRAIDGLAFLAQQGVTGLPG